MKGLAEGSAFGDYRVVRLLGKGGMGEVWLLENATGGQLAAKILTGEADHEARKRFLREAELALGVKHPNLVEAYDVGEDPETGLCYILMEYVPGGTLADVLKDRGALPIEDAVAVVVAMANVLELAREKGIVHRDIKPTNIMFASDGTPKLADLGIARKTVSGDGKTTTVTQTGAMIGTPAYMAPEQMLDAHNVDTRADIYSLGIVFFEMLTGERPNKDDTVVELMAKAVKGEPLPDVRTLRPEVSASLAQLLNMMVEPDKDGRISTPGQVTGALGIIARGGEFAEAAATLRLPASRSSRKRRVKIVRVASLFVLLCLVAAATIVVSRRLAATRLVRDIAIGNPVSTELEPQDVGGAVEKLMDSLLADSAYVRERVGGGRPLVDIAGIQNRTSMKFVTAWMADSIRTHLLRSRMFRFVDPVNPAEQQGAVQMFFGGSVTEMNQNVEGQVLRQYKFTLSLTDAKTGEIFWSDEREIRKEENLR